MPWSEADGPAPLAGIKVLDLTRVVSGPFATMLLADLGADVVKVEEPGKGDESRRYGPPFQGGESAYFLSVNRGKRSIALDLRSEAGRATALALAARADVVVENFRPGTMARLGLGIEALHAANPRLILCSITGFGAEGPDADRPGYDLIVQGESGIMDITGQPDGPPTKLGTSVADLVTGLYASQAVLAALRRRDLSGRGGTVEVAMLDAMASLLTFNAGIVFATGRSPARRGNAHATIVPYETFEAADGWVNIGVANDKFWALFCTAAGCEALRDDPRFATATARVENRDALLALLRPIIRRHGRDAWVARLGAAGVPCGAIRSVGEVCAAPQLATRGMIHDMPHPAAGRARSIASPARFDGRPPPTPGAPPMLDGHRDAVLADWLGGG
ncbi:CaiB/BaiF CoA transferase family protein [Plastoroseomonas hellenica]|uniref:CaiB/BaiF CoA transferase family protein n=1 Tax=Plastoroseomonas hellenica TaxID=2687306 RepID=UPI001BA5FE59|nr:CoA transferase [Plastoroseomonas hellenica]MBR0643051.1 CoA transferase [Plastoroseomonas hellenica]